MTTKHSRLLAEFLGLFVLLPGVFYFYATRWNVHLTLWAVSVYALAVLHRAPDFSWHRLWNGIGPFAGWKTAALRFLLAAPFIIMLTLYLAPDRLFLFPLQRPLFWLVVMILYPILSVIPQELVFRSFFFTRYKPLFPTPVLMIAASALAFGFMHAIFHNLVSPALSLIGGRMFAASFNQHRALKWAALEHAAYGCFVFTAGIGGYFLVGGWRG